ncbi:MAG: tetratricopeptide repeat protein, partial [Syntrophus sp. (in: bacteria)]
KSWDTIKLWDVATGRNTATLTGHSDTDYSVDFSPDGKVIVPEIDDKTIKLWDVMTGRNTATLTGHSDAIGRVNFSPDGQVIVSESADKTIKLWDVTSGRNTATLTGLSDSGTLIGLSDWVKSVNFFPDSKVIVSVSYDKAIKLWDLSPLYNRTPIDERIKAAEAACGLRLKGLELEPFIPEGAARPRWPRSHPYAWLEKAQKGDAEAMYQLGMIYDRDSDLKTAASWYQRASKAGNGPANKRLAFLKREETNKKAGDYIEQAFKHIQAKEWRQAIILCSQALQIQPENTDAYWSRGIAYEELNDIDHAVADFRQAIRLAPGFADAYGSLGWLLISTGHFAEAVAPAKKAYELAPDSYAWTVNYGHTFFLRGERDTAMKYYQETISKVPDEKALQEGPIADFELFINKGWRVKASREMIKWMKEEFRKRPVEKGER